MFTVHDVCKDVASHPLFKQQVKICCIVTIQKCMLLRKNSRLVYCFIFVTSKSSKILGSFCFAEKEGWSVSLHTYSVQFHFERYIAKKCNITRKANSYHLLAACLAILRLEVQHVTLKRLIDFRVV